MCYSAMQSQAAKNKLGAFHFKARSTDDFDDKRVSFPLNQLYVARLDPQGQREYLPAQFGLVPDWVNDTHKGPKFGRNTYNARCETLFEKPSFKVAALRRRALVPLTAFFEFPDAETPPKHRLMVSRKDGEAFWVAALWEWSARYKLDSCTLITVRPMDLLAPLHSRSPLILDDSQVEAWLDPAMTGPEQIKGFLKPHGSEGFQLEQETWKGKQAGSA